MGGRRALGHLHSAMALQGRSPASPRMRVLPLALPALVALQVVVAAPDLPAPASQALDLNPPTATQHALPTAGLARQDLWPRVQHPQGLNGLGMRLWLVGSILPPHLLYLSRRYGMRQMRLMRGCLNRCASLLPLST